MKKMLRIQVACAFPDRQQVISLQVLRGTTVREAILQSGIQTCFPDLSIDKTGIFGKIVSADYILSDAERVEIYRSLLKTPQQARKERAKLSSAG